MTVPELFTLTQMLTAFGVAIGSLGVVAAAGFAGSAIRGALANFARRSATSRQQPQPRSAR